MAKSHSPPTNAPTNVRWLVFLLACATSWFLYLHRYSWGSIKSEIKADFGLGETALGWLDLVFMGAYALFQVPMGFLGDVFGAATVLPAIILAWSGLTAATGLGGGFWSLAGIRAVFGAAQAGAYPNLSKVSRAWFPLRVRTTLQGVVASFAGRSGGACASIVVASLLIGAGGLGWRGALLTIGIAGAALAIAFRLVFRENPREHSRVNDAERALIEAGDPPVPPDVPLRLDRRAPVLRSYSALLVQQFTSAFADMLYVFWIPLFLEEEKGLTKVAMGFYASLPLWGGAAGGIAGGVLNDVVGRVRGRRLARSAIGCAGKLTSAVFLAASVSVEDGRDAMVILAFAKFFTDWSQPTVWGTVTDVAGRSAGSVFGTVNMVGSIGAACAGPVIGWLLEDFGWSTVFWTIVGVYGVSGLCWLAVDATRGLFVPDGAAPRVPDRP